MPVYGGSVGQVAQNEMALGAQQRAAAERQLMMLIQQQQRARDNQQQDRQANRADVHDAQQQQNWMQSMALRKAEGELARREREREFNLQNDYRHDALRESQRTRRQALMQNRRQQGAVQQSQQERALLPYLQGAADEGAWGSAEEYMQSVPPMMFPYAGMFVPRSLEARKSIGAGYQADVADAELLNEGPAQVERYQNMIAAEGDDSWDASRNAWGRTGRDGVKLNPTVRRDNWFNDSPDSAAIDEWKGYVTGIPKKREALLKDPRFTVDANGQYSPVNPAPSWMQRMPVRGTSPETMRPVMGDVRASERDMMQNYPVAPTDPQQRRPGQAYQTPRGALIWTERGTWVTP